MSAFGDIEDDDVYSAEGEPDDEQVARRLHELRSWFAERSGEQVIAWDSLSESERELGRAIAGALIAWLRREGSLR